MNTRTLLFTFLLICTQLTIVSHAATVALKAQQLIDGRQAKPDRNMTVLIEDATIIAVGQDLEIPEDATIIDLGTATLLPGMIDAHTHPLIHDDNDYQSTHLRETSAYKALHGLKAVHDMLESGWTSIRVAGDADVFFANQAIRQAIEEGWVTGPRITGAGHYLSITGGGGDINYISPEQQVLSDGYVVDGVEEMRKAVRREVKFGSDWIKIMVSGAFMSANDNPRNMHYSPEELQVAVDEANRLGVYVMAHAHSADAIKQAVLAGVRSIEHGTYMDDEAIRLMKKHGTYLVPTIYIGDYYIDEIPDRPAQQKMTELSREIRAEFMTSVGKAIRAGVKVTVGTDLGSTVPAGMSTREFATLIEAGMTPMEAIQAGTRVNAELFGWEDRIGTIEAGKLADIIAVRGDPLNDISELERVFFVMKDGRIMRHDQAP